MEFALETFDSEHSEIFRLTRIIEELDMMHTKVATEGMSFGDAQTLNHLVPGFFDERTTKKFTQVPSRTNLSIAMEALDWKRGGVILAIASAIFVLLYKVLDWITGLGSKVGGRGSAAKDEKKTNEEIRENQDKAFNAQVDDIEANFDSTNKDLLRVQEVMAKLQVRQYYKEFLRRVEGNHYKNVNGTTVTAKEAFAAAEFYRQGIFGYDASQRDFHMVVGHMLVSQTARYSPLILLYNQKRIKGSIDRHYLDAVLAEIYFTNEIIGNTKRLIGNMRPMASNAVYFTQISPVEGVTYYDVNENHNFPLKNMFTILRESNFTAAKLMTELRGRRDWSDWFERKDNVLGDGGLHGPLPETLPFGETPRMLEFKAAREKYGNFRFTCWPTPKGDTIVPGTSKLFKEYAAVITDRRNLQDMQSLYDYVYKDDADLDFLTKAMSRTKSELKSLEEMNKAFIKRSEKEQWLNSEIGQLGHPVSQAGYHPEQLFSYNAVNMVADRIKALNIQIKHASEQIATVMSLTNEYKTFCDNRLAASKIGTR